MFYLEKAQLEEVEFLLELSQHGHHLLFDHEAVKTYMAKPMDMYNEVVENHTEEVETLFEKFLSISGIENKREYFKRLHTANQEVVIKTYFTIIDNKMIDKKRIH